MALALEEQRGMLGTVRNAALLLHLLSEGPAHHQLTDLAERAGMSLPTVHRLLRSLAAAGLVEQDPKSSRYGLGAELVYLSERYLARLHVVHAATPYLAQLRDALNVTVLVAVLVRAHVVYVDRIDAGDAGGVFRDSARLRHAFETPAGRLLIARAGADAWRQAEAALTADGAPRPTATDRKTWESAPYLLAVADGGANTCEVAVPIRSRDGVPASLVASGQATGRDESAFAERVVPQLERAAQAVSRTLGHV
jgi:IclR family acetate operon transcriptional repressor